ncbi:MAG: hypothetical protein ABJC24_06435 [Chloroflexota bacterium]
MPPRSAVMILAILAALVAAPSSVFAVAPNELRSPVVTPAAGTTATPFALSVGYRSSAGNPANTVTATVAGNTVSLSLTSGTATDGTWTGGTALPSGSWMVTFHATVAKGRKPSISAGPVNVDLLVTPRPSVPGNSQPSTDANTPGNVTSTAEPRPQTSVRPSPSDAATPASGTPQPSDGAAPAASEASSPRSPGHLRAPHGRSTGADSSTSPAGAVAQSAAPQIPGTTAGVGSDLVGMVLLFGIVGVAAVAMLGAAWIVIASRRDRAEPSLVVADSADRALEAIPTVEQRAMRRARLRPSDDPILTAMGLGDEAQPPPDGGPSDQHAPARRFRRGARSSRPDR